MEIQIDLFNSPSTQTVPMLSSSCILNITINFEIIIIISYRYTHNTIAHVYILRHTKLSVSLNIFSFFTNFSDLRRTTNTRLDYQKQHLNLKFTFLVGYFHFSKRSKRE